VYWPHYFDWGVGDQIASLMRLRKAAGIAEGASVSIQAAEQGRYAAIVDNRLAVKIGRGDWSPGAGWTLSAFGRNYAVWLKG
jgi:alpha-amylase